MRPLLDNAGSLFVAVGRPQRATLVAATQAAVLVIAATPLTLAHGAVGTCIGVGIAFIVGLLLSYRYIGQTTTLALRDAIAVPALAALLSMAAYFLLARGANLNALPLAARVAVKGGFVIGLFFATLFVLQPAVLRGRIRYVWRLLRAGAAG